MKNTNKLKCYIHKEDESNRYYLSAMMYSKKEYKVVISCIQDGLMSVIDVNSCDKANIDKESLLEIIDYWYHQKKACCPITIYLSSLGLAIQLSKIHHSFKCYAISEIIGNKFNFLFEPGEVKRTKVIKYVYKRK